MPVVLNGVTDSLLRFHSFLNSNISNHVRDKKEIEDRELNLQKLKKIQHLL